MYIEQELKKRNLPSVITMNDGKICTDRAMWERRRLELLEIFSKNVYGYMPAAPDTHFIVKESWEDMIGGLGAYQLIEVSFSTPRGPFTFDFDYYYPYTESAVPTIVYLQFNDGPIHSTFPIEKLISNEFAVAMVRYNNIMADVNDFSQGLASMYLRNRAKREPSEWGGIGAWAFASSRIMDFLQNQNIIDKNRIALMGHSRLGKTTLWSVANDDRFALALVSASGNSGASISRGRHDSAESIAQITDKFPHWFCTNYQKYAEHEWDMPFDQHMLAATIAPRRLYVCSGDADTWADPNSEYLCCVAANGVYSMLGLEGFIHPDRYACAGNVFDEGYIAYSMHGGKHFLGEFEWNNTIKYMLKMPSKL